MNSITPAQFPLCGYTSCANFEKSIWPRFEIQLIRQTDKQVASHCARYIQSSVKNDRKIQNKVPQIPCTAEIAYHVDLVMGLGKCGVAYNLTAGAVVLVV
jgi:site-specific recombinase